MSMKNYVVFPVTFLNGVCCQRGLETGLCLARASPLLRGSLLMNAFYLHQSTNHYEPWTAWTKEPLIFA